MKKRLLTGGALVALIAIASLLAFNFGTRSAAGPSLATTGADDPATVTGTAPLVGIAPGETGPVEAGRAESVPGAGTNLDNLNADHAGGPNEGVKVHGRWTIEVTEPDGRLVSLTEFDNALTDWGAQRIARVWSGSSTPGLWEIWLTDTPGTGGPCENVVNSGVPARCMLLEPENSTTGNSKFHTLTVSLADPPSGTPVNSVIRLSGTFTAMIDGQINHVATRQSSCAPNSSPDSCFALAVPWPLTETNISDIAVLAGQQVQVTVDISFS